MKGCSWIPILVSMIVGATLPHDRLTMIKDTILQNEDFLTLRLHSLSKLTSIIDNYEVIYAGQYTLLGMTEPQAVQVYNALGYLYQAFLSVIEDTKATTNGRPSPSPAYKTFFKDVSNAGFVADILTKITAGTAPVPKTQPPQPWWQYTEDGSGSPLIYAVTTPGQVKVNTTGKFDAYEECRRKSGVVAFYPQYPKAPALIVLCPSFFSDSIGIYGDTPPVPVNGQPASN